MSAQSECHRGESTKAVGKLSFAKMWRAEEGLLRKT